MKHIAQNRIQTGNAQSVIIGEVITPTRKQNVEARKVAQKIGHPEGKQIIATVLAAFGGRVIGFEEKPLLTAEMEARWDAHGITLLKP